MKRMTVLTAVVLTIVILDGPAAAQGVGITVGPGGASVDVGRPRNDQYNRRGYRDDRPRREYREYRERREPRCREIVEYRRGREIITRDCR